MPIQFSLREHKVYAAWNPAWTFSKATATILRQRTYPNSSLGAGWIFAVIPRNWVHGKYIRWNWEGYGSLSRNMFRVYIYDGSYDRSSDVDFPSGSGLLIKGNGLLQTLDINTGTFPAETKDIQVNVAGGSEDYCTLFFYLGDAWAAYNFWEQIDWVEINDGAGGAGNQYSEHFTDSVHMERTGTVGDYGYISTGTVIPYGSESLFATFDVRQETSADLPAGFRLRQDVEDLPAVFTVAQWQEDLPAEFVARYTATRELFGKFVARRDGSEEILGIFDARHTDLEELPGEFIARRSASVELHGAFDGQVSLNLPADFWIKQWQEDLLGEFIIRHATSNELSGEFVVRHPGSQELLAGFMIRQIGSADCPGGFVVRHSVPVPYLTPWGKRKLHTVKGSIDGVLTDYVVGIKVYYGAGVDGTESAKGTIIGKVYCNSNCKTDFGDIRFTAVDGITELDYWMEEKTDGVSAVFWVKIPSIPLSPNTVNIYVYYGNNSATTTSDGNATFLIFDDFDGDALDTDKWDENAGGNTAVVADSKLKVNITSATYWIDSKIAYDFPDNVEIMSYLDINGMAGTGYRCLSFITYDRNAVIPAWGGSWYRSDDQYSRRVHGVFSFWWGVWKGATAGETRHAVGSRSDDWFDWFVEGTQNYNESITSSNNWRMCDTRYLRYLVAGYTANNVDLFWIAVRPGTLNVPTHTAWGSEDPPYPQGLLAILDVGQDSEDLAAQFQIGQGSQDLPAVFQSGQGWENLPAEFVVNISASSVDLLGIFDIQPSGSEELLGIFTSRQTDSEELLGIFSARRDASEDLLGEFIVRLSSSVDLAGEFIVRHPASQNLLAVFSAGGIASVDLLGVFNVRQADSVSLLGIFTSRQTDSAELLAIFSTRRDASEELLGIFTSRQTDSAELLGIFSLRQAGSAGLLGIFTLSQSDSENLLGTFTIRNSSSADLLAVFEAIRDASAELLGIFTPRRADSEDLLASFDGQASQSLLAIFEAQRDASANLFCEFIPRRSNSTELLGVFSIRHDGSEDLLASFDGQVSQNLYGQFNSRHVDSVDLPGEFIPRRSTSEELLGTFTARHTGTLNLPSLFTIQHDDSTDLLGIFTSRHATSQDLPGEFIARHSGLTNLPGEAVVRHSGLTELLGEFIARHVGTQDLLASFDGQVSVNLLGVLVIRHSTSAELSGEVIVRHSSLVELYGEFIIRHDGSAELLGLTNVRHSDTADLYAEFIIRHSDSVELPAGFDGQAVQSLPAEFVSRHSDSVDLPAEFESGQGSEVLLGVLIVRHSDSVDLFTELVIRHTDTVELSAEFIIRHDGSVDLSGDFVVRHSTSADLLANFEVVHWQRLLGVFAVRHPYPFWTDRRWVDSVVELSEDRISDAFLEEIISGVMDDVRTWLLANEAGPYTTWTDIENTPIAIRRATTYGVVASLYARNIYGALGRFVLKVAPVDVKVLTTSEIAMEYWEALMNRVLELYLSAQGLKRIWVDTATEDPVFTMDNFLLWWLPE